MAVKPGLVGCWLYLDVPHRDINKYFRCLALVLIGEERMQADKETIC